MSSITNYYTYESPFKFLSELREVAAASAEGVNEDFMKEGLSHLDFANESRISRWTTWESILGKKKNTCAVKEDGMSEIILLKI